MRATNRSPLRCVFVSYRVRVPKGAERTPGDVTDSGDVPSRSPDTPRCDTNEGLQRHMM